MRRTHAGASGCALALVLAACPSAPVPPAPAPAAASRGGPIWFVDVTRQAGLAIPQEAGGSAVDYIIESLGTGAAWLDYDGDGDPDLYLAQGATREQPQNGPPDLLLRNDGDSDGDGVPRWTDVTRQAGLGDTLWSFGVAVADYDNDGDADLHLANWGPDRLYRNDGDGTFTEIGRAAGLADDALSVGGAWGDVDRDGDLDLYVVNYVAFDFDRYPGRGAPQRGGAGPCTWRGIEVFCGPRNLEPAHNAFYRNDGDSDGDGVPAFTEATAQAGLATAEGFYSLAARFFDADGDGDPDLYVANDSLQNLFFVNRGDGTFEERGMLSGLAYNEEGKEQASMGLAVGDYDGDGRFDLAVTNFSHDHDTLYRNEGGGQFRDVSFPAGLGSPTFFPLAWGVEFGDLDRDGWEDLFIANGHVYPQVDAHEVGTSFRQLNGVFRNRGDGVFEEVGPRAGPGLALAKASRAVLPVDLEPDGDIDLLVTSLDDTPDLLRNDGNAPAHWLAVKLRGTRSNRDGLGALVLVAAGARTQVRELTRSTSYAGSTLPIAIFGLGGAAVADRIEVRWPSGRRTALAGQSADRVLEIVEPER